jgi:hypothetical protein
MRRLNTRAPQIAGLLALALGAAALLALSGVAAAKDRHGDDHGHHGRHHHHHHQFEMREAGTISSFEAATGKLTIALIDGEMVTGLVTEDTRIKCEGFDDNRLDRRDHGSGDDHGGRGNEPGDDDGGRFEPGDDNGGNSGPGPNGSSGSGSTPGGPGPSNEVSRPIGGEGPECTTASLVPGAFVGDAELRLEGGGAVFTEVELGHDS